MIETAYNVSHNLTSNIRNKSGNIQTQIWSIDYSTAAFYPPPPPEIYKQ